MKIVRLNAPLAPGTTGPDVEVLLNEGLVKVRRIDLAAGTSIPPCQMREDVVFVVLSGRVVFTSGDSAEAVEAPGAVYIPGGDATRSLKAETAARVLAVLCRAKETPGAAE